MNFAYEDAYFDNYIYVKRMNSVEFDKAKCVLFQTEAKIQETTENFSDFRCKNCQTFLSPDNHAHLNVSNSTHIKFARLRQQ